MLVGTLKTKKLTSSNWFSHGIF